MSLVNVVRTYSDTDMACPDDWENGYKEGIVGRFGDSERSLCDHRTGERAPATMDIDFIDDRRFREQLASRTTFWSNDWVVKMTSRANRAVRGPAYEVFKGPVINAQPTWNGQKRGYRITLGDLFTRVLQGNPGRDRDLIPWRKIGDGPLGELLSVDDSLDPETPEPIIYGRRRRFPETDPASADGFCIVPTYLGTRDLSGQNYHVWLVAGHAVKSIPFWRVSTGSGEEETHNDYSTEGTEWIVPGQAGFLAEFGAAYEDILSSTYGNLRRYALFYGKVTDMSADPDAMTDPDACAAGHKQLLIGVDGIEDAGDSTGDLVLDRIQQFKHFKINFWANRGPESYQSGPWLANPTRTIFDVAVPVVDEDSYDLCSGIAQERLPNDDPDEAGYIGSAVIGAHAGDRFPMAKWDAEWCRSCGLVDGPNRLGQDVAVMLHPTAAIKDAAPLITDANEILLDSFGVDVRYSVHANRVPGKADYDLAKSIWRTTFTAEWPSSVLQYDEVLSEPIEYPFAPGITAAYHLALIEVKRSEQPPRFIEFHTTIEEQNGDSVAYLDLGDYVNYRHVAAVSTSASQERLAQVIAIQVQVGPRRVHVLAVDCEDLIDYDVLVTDSGGGDDTPPDGDPGDGAVAPEGLVTGTTEDITCP